MRIILMSMAESDSSIGMNGNTVISLVIVMEKMLAIVMGEELGGRGDSALTTTQDKILFLGGNYEAQRLVHNYANTSLKQFLRNHFVYSTLRAEGVEMLIS